MLKKLRREFTAITMVLVGLVLVAALGSTYLSNSSTQHAITNSMLERALSEDENPVPMIGEGGGGRGSGGVVAIIQVNTWGTVLATSGEDTSSEMLGDVIPEALASQSASGHSEAYHVAWMKAETSAGYRLAICDTYSRDLALHRQLVDDLVIVAVAMTALYVVVRLLSGWALRPVEEAWDRQRRFVSDASHELKTPLAVILANAQILEKDRGVPEESRRWIESTTDEATHMKALVEDLLTLARADEQRAAGSGAAAVREDIDLTALVDSCALEFDAVAFERGCTLECELAEGLHVEGDRTQLSRAVRTLLDNATKYARHDTPVRVTLAHEGKHVRLAVSNLGEQIAPEDLEHLFDRFYRTDDARERQSTGGFGLGLAIAKSIVEAHGGKIFATSTPEGLTTFTVTL